MEATTRPETKVVSDGAAPAETADNAERILKFSAQFKDRVTGPVLSPDRAASVKRDWSSALDLVNEAFEAIRMAEERAAAAEDYQQQLILHHEEQMRGLEARLHGAEKRAEAAESRARDAESWLNRFHDTIVEGFQRTFTTR